MLIKKMFRDILKNKIQFLSIFLMTFLGAWIFTGIGSEYTGIDAVANNYYKKTNAADIRIYGNDFDNEKIAEIKKIDNVIEIEKRLTISGTQESEKMPHLDLNFVSENNISKLYIEKGKQFSKNEKGIYLDSLFAKENKIKVNDKIKINYLNEQKTFKVVALVTNADYLYFSMNGDMMPNHKRYGFTYLSKEVLPKHFQNMYSSILIKTNGKDDKSTASSIKNIIDNNKAKVILRDDMTSYKMLNEEIEQHRTMGSIFPIVFLLIAILSVLTTMIRLISNQRQIISTLKALGIKKRKILFHYLSYGFLISLLGTIAGVIIGPMTLPYLFYPSLSKSFSLPNWEPFFSISFLIVPILLTIVCTFVTYLVCRSYVNESPVKGMKNERRSKIKASKLEKTKLWKKLSFSNQWNFRDILRNKARSLMAMVGIIGCTGLLICAFGLLDSINNFISWNFNELNNYQTQINLKDSITKKEINDLVQLYSGEKVMIKAVEVKNKDENIFSSIRVIEDGYKLINLKDDRKKTVKVDKDAFLISSGLANKLLLTKGDTIKWNMGGNSEWHSTKITGIYYEPVNQGISMNQTTFKKYSNSFKATQILTKENKVKMTNKVNNILEQDNLEKEMRDRMSSVNIMVYILILGAVTMILIVLYCLGIISFSEKYRDFATLKVLGFKTKQIRLLLIQQNVYLGLLSIPFGCLFGSYLLESIMSDMDSDMDFNTVITNQTYALCIAGTILLIFIISTIFSKRSKYIDMVAALKANE